MNTDTRRERRGIDKEAKGSRRQSDGTEYDRQKRGTYNETKRMQSRNEKSTLVDGRKKGGEERWKDDGLERWKDGRLEKWRDGRMEVWKDGGMEE